MKAYYIIRDWVDRQWRGPGLQFKVLLLPAIVPFLAILIVGSATLSIAVGWIWFGLWNGFVAWRYWAYLKDLSRDGDEKYDRVGKFRLSKEYHDTESATAAKRKRKR